MQSKAKTVEEYLDSLPLDRQIAMRAVRATILANLDRDYEEGMQYGMVGYYVPHRVHPAGYHCDPKQPLPFAGLASQKSHMALYLMPVYGDGKLARWFRAAWTKGGRKLDMGKACVRFRSLDDVPLDVVGTVIKRMPATRWIEFCTRTVAARGTSTRKPARKAARTKSTKAVKR